MLNSIINNALKIIYLNILFASIVPSEIWVALRNNIGSLTTAVVAVLECISLSIAAGVIKRRNNNEKTAALDESANSSCNIDDFDCIMILDICFIHSIYKNQEYEECL